MYKLFLCLRYLRLRLIAYLPMVAVALCVAMVLIAVSVMNGFLHRIELAAKGLFGDIVVEAGSSTGLARYDEFIEEIRQKLPDQVEDGSPFILNYGIMDLPGKDRRQPVQIAGIRLSDPAHAGQAHEVGLHTRVSSFAKGLYFQEGLAEPTFDPSFGLLARRLGDLQNQTSRTVQQVKSEAPSGKPLPPEKEVLLERLGDALAGQRGLQERFSLLDRLQATIKSQIDQAQASGDKKAVADLRARLDQLPTDEGILPPDKRVILGLGLPGLSFRTDKGQTIRSVYPGDRITLTLIPLGLRSASNLELQPKREQFTIVDDCHTDVSSIDSSCVYLPFETLQSLNNMGPRELADEPGKFTPGRCSQIHIKVKEGYGEGEKLEQVAHAVEGLWVEFQRKHPDALPSRGGTVYVQSWRVMQAPLVNQIAAQRTLVVIMFGIISLVSVVLIFAIFYMIVFQKTKDIGVIKSVGGSNLGVAGIFLSYGAAVGLVGSIAGVVIGWIFVLQINPIHDWVGRTFGLVVWNREWFMFDKIPNEVNPLTALLIVVAAILAGLLGSLAPALMASRMQPVEALRYE